MTLNALEIDNSHSQVSFQTKKLGFFTIKGTLSDFQGEIIFDKNDLQNSNFDNSVSAVSIDTGNAKRDEHLKSNNFFYVKEFPKISFHSIKILKENNHYSVKGKLTILNTTKEIAILFSYENNLQQGGFSLNRLDYGVGEKFPGFIVGKTVRILINTKTK